MRVPSYLLSILNVFESLNCRCSIHSCCDGCYLRRRFHCCCCCSCCYSWSHNAVWPLSCVIFIQCEIGILNGSTPTALGTLVNVYNMPMIFRDQLLKIQGFRTSSPCSNPATRLNYFDRLNASPRSMPRNFPPGKGEMSMPFISSINNNKFWRTFQNDPLCSSRSIRIMQTLRVRGSSTVSDPIAITLRKWSTCAPYTRTRSPLNRYRRYQRTQPRNELNWDSFRATGRCAIGAASGRNRFECGKSYRVNSCRFR